MSKRTGFLFIGFVVLSAVALVLLVQRNGNDAITNGNSVSNTNTATTDYTPVLSDDGSLTLKQAAETTVTGEIMTYRFLDGNSLSVMPAALQSVVLNETPIQSEKDITVQELPATRYTLSSAKDGSLFTVVQVISEGKLYDFRGSEEYLTNLDNYITFNIN